jgi:beta-galactosidase
MLSNKKGGHIRFDGGNILIDGRPTIVLCSSLFYFRIPRGFWRERLRTVREAGYNCIDVYLPWNHHESRQGNWDFSGERDVAAFLQLAAAEGLWVLARPGPYICSEWDGGGLPAYLLTERAMRLRDNDALYLRHVARWFDQIMPVISHFQLGAAGTVIAVQIENELDFYDCADPRGYQEALRDMALGHNISVPLVACAGQGDIERAGGFALGIVPSCNFYPNDHEPSVEDHVAPYYALLRTLGLPLLVTETNRAHFLLRRLLSAGAKLLGPYLQAGGFNFGFTNGSNNWGDPQAFLTSEYDFGGMIGPYGELRPTVGEARRLSLLIRALGPALAAATPTADHGIAVETDLPLIDGSPRALALAGGGLLLALPNLSGQGGQVRLRYKVSALPVSRALTVEPDCCPFVLFDFPLATWLAGAAIAYSSAELCAMHLDDPQAMLAFSGPGEVDLVLPGVCAVEAASLAAQRDGDRVTLLFDSQAGGTATILLGAGKSLRVVQFSPELVARLLDLTPAGDPVFSADPPARPGTAEGAAETLRQWSALAQPDPPHALAEATMKPSAAPLALEEAGIGRGFGWYEARIEVPQAATVSGFLVQGGGDVVSLYWGERYQGTMVPGGASYDLPAGNPPTEERRRLAIRAEIWGHSNFDDARLPGLRLSALKGLAGVTAITSRRPISENWRWYQGIEPGMLPAHDPNTYSAPLVAWGKGLTTRAPERSLYRKEVQLSPAADTWILNFAAIAAVVRVWVNNQPCGIVNPRDPFVDLTAHVGPGGTALITLEIERWHGEGAGEVILLEGRRATDWTVRGGGELELWSAACLAASDAEASGLPYRLASGGVAWLFAAVDHLGASGASWTLHFSGCNAKLTAFFNSHGVGRIWLPSAGRPAMRGGNSDALYLPAPWFQPGENLLALLVEAVAQDEDAEIVSVAVQRKPVHMSDSSD